MNGWRDIEFDEAAMHRMEAIADREQTMRESKAKADWKHRAEVLRLCQYCPEPATHHGRGRQTGLAVVTCEKHSVAADPDTLVRFRKRD